MGAALSLYQFKPEDAEGFADFVHARTRREGKELKFLYCPYCHGGKKPDKDTFSINLETGSFNCKRGSCGVKGNMITLSRDFGFSLGKDADAYFQRYTWNRFKSFKKADRKIESSNPALNYMSSRFISPETCKKYEITSMPDNPDTIVFPFKNPAGELKFIKYRNSKYTKESKGSKEWTEKNCMPILFGMNHCDPVAGPLVLTEGQIDSLSVAEAGIPNAVSVPMGKNGFTWIPYCWDWLQQFKELIVFGDYENGSITLLDQMEKRFAGVVKHVRPEDYLDCKDANDILRKYGKKAVQKCVQNAEAAPDPHIKLLADVEHKILTEEDRMSTGLRKLDSIIGGFYNGQLILLTGERGLGKSTLASQFALHAVRQDITCFLYSGEINDWQLQNWFEQQVAGPDRIEHEQAKDSDYVKYEVAKQFRFQVRQFYHDLVYFYDSNRLGTDEDNEKLLDTLKKAITQFGCRFLIIDNLMTAVEDDLTSDIYRQQTAFVKNLARMCNVYNVIILLILHPKKRGMAEWNMDDLLGSSNIPNLADIVLRYAEPNQEMKDATGGCVRCLQVWKNRLTGRTEKKGIPLFYEESSKRISENYDFMIDTVGGGEWMGATEQERIEIPF